MDNHLNAGNRVRVVMPNHSFLGCLTAAGTCAGGMP